MATALHKRLQNEAEFSGVALKKVQAASRQVQADLQQLREDAAKAKAAEYSSDSEPSPQLSHGQRRQREQIRHSPLFEGLVGNARGAMVASMGTTTQLGSYASDGRLADIKRLLQSKADVNGVTNIGSQPIHEAAVGGHSETVAYLLECRADPDARQQGNDGVFPLGKAAAQGHVEAAQTLLAHKADAKGRCAVSPAALRGHDDCLAKLLEARAYPEGRTAAAAAHGLVCSALGLVACHGRVSSARMLVKAGADVSARSATVSLHGRQYVGGQTPLHLAAQGWPDRGVDRTKETAKGRAEVWVLLVAHGASPYATNDAGETARDLAKSDRLFMREPQGLEQRSSVTQMPQATFRFVRFGSLAPDGALACARMCW